MPRQHLTPRKDPVPIVQEAGWASEPVWTGAENLVPPGFDPRTVQPVGSRYTDYATRHTKWLSKIANIHAASLSTRILYFLIKCTSSQ